MRTPTCTLLCLLCYTSAFSQINNYVSNTWKIQPQLTAQTDTSVPVTLLKFIVARDFNRPTADGSHSRTIYKRIRINTQRAADSISMLLIPLETYENIKSVDARIIYPDGTFQKIHVFKTYSEGKAEMIKMSPLKLVPGCEIEYDMLVQEATTWAGFEYMQSVMPCDEATFMLVLPPNVLFRTRGSNGFPDVTDSISYNGVHYFHATAYHVPALFPGDLFYYNTWLQRTEFSLRESNWEQPAKDQFLQYVNIEKTEYKKLEKEVKKWAFLKTPSPLPVLIYQVEQQIKSQYKLINDPDNSSLSDINIILKTNTCNETGMVKLMSSIYYLLGVHAQILFTAGKESVPLDSSIVNIELASNVLIYFPELRQALAPAAVNTRFPFYPASWAGIMALRCRDTLIDKKADVLVDFIRTPVIDYTKNNISLEANIDINVQGVNDVKIKQTVGGYPGMSIKTIIGNTPLASLEDEYNSMLPTGAIRVAGLTHNMQNGYWEQPVADAPFILESSFKTDSIGIGILINGLVQQYVSMPPAGIPVEMAFPFYQESRIYITVPEGYKLVNTADYVVDIPGVSLGYKVTCKQDGNKITIYGLKWFKKSSFSGEEKKVFEKILKADNELKNKRLYISKS